MTRYIKLLLGLVLTLGALMHGPQAFAQLHPLYIDSPAASEVGAGACDAPEIAPLESVLPDPEPVSKRLFGIIPNYRASATPDNYKPLTTSEKYHMAFQDSFDWPNFFLLAGYAAQSQVAASGFHHNGGLAGFGEYYARGFSDQIIGSYVTDAILPTLLHEDPRYFRLGTGTFWRRTYYARRGFLSPVWIMANRASTSRRSPATWELSPLQPRIIPIASQPRRPRCVSGCNSATMQSQML